MESEKLPMPQTVPLPFADKPSWLQAFALLSSMCLLSVTSYQVSLSVRDYLQYPTVVTVDNSEGASFPELVFCNNVPLSFTTAAVNMMLFKSQLEGFSVAYSRVENVTSSTMDIEAVLHTIGRGAFKKYLGIWPETLVFSCLFDDGSDCSGGQHFEHVDSPAYVNCFRFVPNRTFTSVTFVLFSESLIGSSDLSRYFINEDKFPLSAIAMDGSLEYDKSSGAVVYIKHKQYFMHPSSMVLISTGQSNVVTYTENYRLTISKPEAGSPCLETPTTASYQMYFPVDSGADVSGTITAADYLPAWQEFVGVKRDCALRAMADYLQDTCQCRDPYLPIDSKRAALANCRDARQPNYRATSACYRLHKSLMGNVSTSHCVNPCEQRSYSTQVTGTKWPLESNIRSVVNNVIRPRKIALEAMYGKKMYGLSYILQLSDLLNDTISSEASSNSSGVLSLSSQNQSMQAALNMLPASFDSAQFDHVQLDNNSTRLGLLEKLSSAVTSNFVKLQIRADSDTVQSVTEAYKYVLSNVMSEIGGLLGLYLGWSVLTFIELLHLIHMALLYTVYKLSDRGSGRQKLQQHPTAGSSGSSGMGSSIGNCSLVQVKPAAAAAGDEAVMRWQKRQSCTTEA